MIRVHTKCLHQLVIFLTLAFTIISLSHSCFCQVLRIFVDTHLNYRVTIPAFCIFFAGCVGGVSLGLNTVWSAWTAVLTIPLPEIRAHQLFPTKCAVKMWTHTMITNLFPIHQTFNHQANARLEKKTLWNYDQCFTISTLVILQNLCWVISIWHVSWNVIQVTRFFAIHTSRAGL